MAGDNGNAGKVCRLVTVYRLLWALPLDCLDRAEIFAPGTAKASRALRQENWATPPTEGRLQGLYELYPG